MKQRIQEALRRRHRKGDEGFTLIELLVVILIIAILAAVGIVALLSALNSGKKSAAKTTLRNAVTAVKSVQTGDGVADYSTVTLASVGAAEPDIDFVADVTTSTKNSVGIEVVDASNVYLQTKDASGNCFYVHLASESGTTYASFKGSCTKGSSVASSLFTKDQTAGWQPGTTAAP